MASKNCGGSFASLWAGGSCTSGDSAVQSTVSIGVACFDFGVDFAERFWGRERERDVGIFRALSRRSRAQMTDADEIFEAAESDA